VALAAGHTGSIDDTSKINAFAPHTYEELSQILKDHLNPVPKIIEAMYNILTKGRGMSHKEAIAKIYEDHKDLPGFSQRNIRRCLPEDNPKVPRRRSRRIRPKWPKDTGVAAEEHAEVQIQSLSNVTATATRGAHLAKEIRLMTTKIVRLQRTRDEKNLETIAILKQSIEELKKMAVATAECTAKESIIQFKSSQIFLAKLALRVGPQEAARLYWSLTYERFKEFCDKRLARTANPEEILTWFFQGGIG
jgi:hypothetical protein